MSQSCWHIPTPDCWGKAFGPNVVFGPVSQQSSDIVYHEYTHNVIYKLYGESWIDPTGNSSTEAFAMDEGFPDFFAAAFENDPLLGEGASCAPNRDLRNSYTMAEYDPGNMRLNSLIISGAVWDLRPGERFSTSSSTFISDLTFETLWWSWPDTFLDFALGFEDTYLAGSYPDPDFWNAMTSSSDFRGFSTAGQHKQDQRIPSSDEIPATGLSISDPYPNPSTSSSTITFELDKERHVQAVVYDMLGREVGVLTDRSYPKGLYKLNMQTLELATGKYLIRFNSDNYVLTKVLFIRK